jgi:hypothetical protein
MKSGMTTGLRVAAWSTSALLLMGAAAGTAEAVTGHSKADAPGHGPGGPGGPGFGGPGGPQGQVVHSIATVKTKAGKYQKVEFQVGKVEEATAESITVLSSDEYAQTYVLSSSTVYCKNGKKVTLSKITEGDTVSVQAVKSGSHYTAKLVLDGLPPAPPKGKGGPHGPGGAGGPGGPGSGEGGGSGS